jgi:hypothetical protein
MIPTAADLRLLHRYDRSNPWELAVHGAGHLVAARDHHRHLADGLLLGTRHLDPVEHVEAILGLSTAAPASRATILLAGYAANEVARDQYRSPEDLVYCVDEDDHDGVHLLDVVTHLPDATAERFLLAAAGEAARLVRDRWADVAQLAAGLHDAGKVPQVGPEGVRRLSA